MPNPFVLCSVWLIHGIMQSSLTIFMNDDSARAGKIEDEEDPSPSETEENSTRKMSGSLKRGNSHEYYEHRSLRLFSSLHSAGKERDTVMDDDTCVRLPDAIDEGLPASTSSVSTRGHSLAGSSDKQPSLLQSSIQAIEEGENEDDTCKAPDTTSTKPMPSASAGLQSRRMNNMNRSRSTLFNPSEVMHLMGFDESTTNGEKGS